MEKYVFKPYSKGFPDLFDKEKARIAPHLGAKAIEHVGSTAVPGLGGKGIIDIAIAVKKSEMEKTIPILMDLGYEFRPHHSTPERFYFIGYLPDEQEGTRRYHLHMTYPESGEWNTLLGFRDYLRAHPEEARSYADLKEKAALEAEGHGETYRKLKEPIFRKVYAFMQRDKISFRKASIVDWEAISAWLDEPHVKEFWDNSPQHREDIHIFMEGRKQLSPYWDGMFTYWVALIDKEPYALLMTSEILATDDLPEHWGPHLSKTGKTISLDFMIGNHGYLGKGLGGVTLDAFATFFVRSIDPTADMFFIDPAENNPRAVRVYEKGGFEQTASFVRDTSVKKDVRHFLMIKKMKTE